MSHPSKLPHIGTTIFTTMSAMARHHDAINLSQGFPDFSPDQRLLDFLDQAFRSGHHQYAPMPGLPQLRQQISRRVFNRDGYRYDPDTDITLTSGATEALFCASQALVHPGDEVILFSPAYDSYAPGIRLAGGTPVYVPLDIPNYRIPWGRVAASIGPRTAGIFLNHPHNPTGTTIRKEDLNELAAITEAHNLWVVSDEVYDYMVFDGQTHKSLAGHDRLRERSLVISSFGKTLHATGWKVGYCLAPKSFTQEFRKVHQFVTFSVPTPFQHAIATYLKHHEDVIDALPHFYQQKRDHFRSLMRETPFELLACEGTYFQLAKYDNISARGDVAFSEWLTRKIGVACIPVSVFYPDQTDHQVVRFCFAKENDTLAAAADRLASL